MAKMNAIYLLFKSLRLIILFFSPLAFIFSFNFSVSKLFPGGHQRIVYHTKERDALQSEEGRSRSELDFYGMKPEDIGIHSIRKGVCTFVTSGSTICNIVAVCQRAGWTMGVQGRYFKNEGAGDCMVGRACAGMPIHSKNFCKLPPRFIRSTTNDPLVASAIKDCFPTLASKNLDGVLSLCLASIVYHQRFLEDTLPFIKEKFFENLMEKVVCCYEWDDCNFDRFVAKGTSPYHHAIKEREEMNREQVIANSKLEQLTEKVSQLPKN